MTPDFVAGVLVGGILGVVLLMALTGLLIWVLEVRSAVREGTALVGDGIERAKKRGEL